MMLPLLLSLVVSVTDDPPVKVWLNHDNYFPRGDETIEVRGRGDREAFFVDDREGSGLVLAARSSTPFKFDEFVRGDHWDYRVLDARQAGDDKEAALVDMVQRMTPDGHFDYDAVTYVVASARAYYDSYYPQYAVNFGYGWGWPYGYRYAALYSTCYDPFFYDPFLCYDPIFARPYGYGFYGYGFYGYQYRPFYGGGYSFSNRPRNLFINRVRNGTGVQMYFKDRLGSNAVASGVGPRFRVPDGTLVARGRPNAAPVRERDAMQRDRGDRVSFPVRDRGAVRDGGGVRDGGDRPDRSQPTAREPDRRGASSGGGGGGGGRDRDAGRATPERRGGGGGGGGWSAPRAPSGGDRGGRAAPANRGGGGGGGGHGNSGGGSRRRP